jgi:hypothetical protein
MMKAQWMLCVATVGCLCFVPLSSQAGDKVKKLESKAEKGTCAVAVDFAKDLGLSFPSLTTLGARIEQARQHSDPVGLALAGRELAIAEKVSGKQTTIKGSDLLKEAAQLAKRRFDPAELKAVAMLTDSMGADLKDLVAKAEKAQADAKAAKNAGEKSRGIQRTLHADSRVTSTISVYVDGRYIGTMGSFGDIYYYVGQTPWETTYLSARSSDGRSWSMPVSSAVGDYHWILYP